jgi:uncharacterized protein (TIGR00255 family)
MAIQSMTGFARVAAAAGGRAFAWEIRSVNGRGLDIRLRTPPGFDSIGEEARKRMAASASRGTVHVTLTLSAQEGPKSLSINGAALDTLLRAVSDLKLPLAVSGATLDGLLAVRGVVEATEDDPLAQLDEMRAPLLAAFERALAAFAQSRRSEGAALAQVLAGQLEQIEGLTTAVENHPGRTADAIRARLAEQVAALMDTGKAFDADRLHQEAALLATKSDVREEIDRLKAHIAAARELIDKGDAVGRRLDFLAQEFGRESSTLCAKANDVALSRLGLELRAVVDQLREQVQNVE